jgi:hypothetical protein
MQVYSVIDEKARNVELREVVLWKLSYIFECFNEVGGL